MVDVELPPGNPPAGSKYPAGTLTLGSDRKIRVSVPTRGLGAPAPRVTDTIALFAVTPAVVCVTVTPCGSAGFTLIVTVALCVCFCAALSLNVTVTA